MSLRSENPADLSARVCQEILVCPECLHPVDKLVICPACNKPVEKMPSLLLPILRILRAKGWVVDKWEKRQENNSVSLHFYRFSPPLIKSSGGFWSQVLFELKNFNPVIFVANGSENACKVLYDWASQSPCFAIPFGQDFCDECKQQGGNWHFSQCNCSATDKDRYIRFADGLPEHCRYADAQVVTLENRFKQLGRFFWKNPITRRKAMRQLPKQL
jgi:hypothetical protein